MPSYAAQREHFKTGDIILFEGYGLVSSIISKFTRSPVTHIGMVVCSHDLDSVFLFESTTLSKVKDVRTGEPRRGVQIVQLSERVRDYKRPMWIRHWHGPRTPQMISALNEFRREVAFRDYEKNIFELIASSVDNVDWYQQEDLSSIFCSELVAEAHQRMGILSEVKPSNEYVPADYTTERQELMIANGNFGVEIELTW